MMDKPFLVIPFRANSARFPNKILAKFNGMSLLENTLSIASCIQDENIILTSSIEDYEFARDNIDISKYPYTFVPSSKSCASATERIIEIFKEVDICSFFVSIPIDEALLIPEELQNAILSYDPESEYIKTLSCDFYCREDAESSLSAKIAVGFNERAVYFSRAVIPAKKNGMVLTSQLKKHIGVYMLSYRVLKFLYDKRNIKTILDSLEGLEQLRWLELGVPVYTEHITHYGYGIDIPEQINELEKRKKCLQKQEK